MAYGTAPSGECGREIGYGCAVRGGREVGDDHVEGGDGRGVQGRLDPYSHLPYHHTLPQYRTSHSKRLADGSTGHLIGLL
eukprot:857232-Rhodomonas_salina.4